MKQFDGGELTEKRKHITFQNQDGKEKCVTAICPKTFIWTSVREALEYEFNGNYERVRAEQINSRNR